jgi:sulfite exporter TauE/SafE/plastocyanin domain-containing protein
MELFIPSLVLGLVTSLHCVSMCGPMVVTYALKGAEDGTVVQRLAPNLAYQVAKIASYVLVGLLLGAAGSALDLDAVRPYVMLIAGAYMIVLALSMTGRARWAARFTPRPPAFLLRAFTAVRRKAVKDAEHGRPTIATPVTFGLLTGLMPCAPLMAAQLNAAASGSAASGAVAMFAFGLGTAPLILGFGTASGLLPRQWKERMMTALAVVVIVFGVTYLNRGAMLLGSPVTLQSARNAVFGQSASVGATGYAIAPDGVTEVPLVIEGTRFVPDTLAIPANTPVRLIVDRRESSPCSDQLVVPELGVLADLADNATTVIELPATRDGQYTLTCGMGMMSGSLVVGGPGSAIAPTASAATPAETPSVPACACCGNSGTGETIEGAASVEGDVQRISVDATNGYDPNVIRLTAGVPAEITFSQASGCMAEVMSEGLDFYADLTGGPRTIRIEADALQPGEYSFSCGMQMVFGTIIVD